ncbi:MAG: hypothetical protein ACYC1D_10770 [Acidimicrobiales bacterium]
MRLRGRVRQLGRHLERTGGYAPDCVGGADRASTGVLVEANLIVGCAEGGALASSAGAWDASSAAKGVGNDRELR